MEWILEDLGGGREITMVKIHVGNSQKLIKKIFVKEICMHRHMFVTINVCMYIYSPKLHIYNMCQDFHLILSTKFFFYYICFLNPHF